MDLRPGYKQTEIGPIPEDWDAVPLGDLFTFKNGLNKAKKFFGYGTPIVNYMDVFRHPGLRLDRIEGRVDVSKSELEAFEVRKGDVFFTRTSETVEVIGVAAAMLDPTQDTVFSGFVLRGRPTDDRLDDLFKAYCFSPRYFRRQVVARATYTTRALTNGRSLSAAILAVPPLAEQQAIAEALSDVDAAINNMVELIAKKRDIKSGAMQRLLTGETRLPDFTAPWEKERLGDILAYEQPTKYLVGSSKYSDSFDVPVITAGKSFVLGYTDEKIGLYKNLPVIVFDDFTTASRLLDFPFKVKSSAVKLLKLKNTSMVLRVVHGIMAKVKIPIVDHKRRWISEYQHQEVFLPTPDEQMAIAKVLDDIQAEITALEARLEKARAIKQGMMQSLLTGRVRLPAQAEALDALEVAHA